MSNLRSRRTTLQASLGNIGVSTLVDSFSHGGGIVIAAGRGLDSIGSTLVDSLPHGGEISVIVVAERGLDSIGLDSNSRNVAAPGWLHGRHEATDP